MFAREKKLSIKKKRRKLSRVELVSRSGKALGTRDPTSKRLLYVTIIKPIWTCWTVPASAILRLSNVVKTSHSPGPLSRGIPAARQRRHHYPSGYDDYFRSGRDNEVVPHTRVKTGPTHRPNTDPTAIQQRFNSSPRHQASRTPKTVRLSTRLLSTRF